MFENIRTNLASHIAIMKPDELVTMTLSNGQARRLLAFLNDCRELTCETHIDASDPFMKEMEDSEIDRLVKSETGYKFGHAIVESRDLVNWEFSRDYQQYLIKIRGSVILAGGKHARV